MEMTRAYASVLTGNANVEAYTIKSIIDGTGQRLHTRQTTQSAENIGSNANRAMMLDLLQAVVQEGTGKGARIRGVAVAGKTGTSQDHRDAWFVGFTQDLVVGVWVGNDDNSPTRGVVGGDLPAGIWNDFMTRALPSMKAKLAASAKSPTVGGSPSTTGVAPSRDALRGRARALDTGTLDIGGSVVRLQGLMGERGRMADRLDRLLRRREIVCEPVRSTDVHQCRIGDEDLSEIVLAGGGARVRPDAPDYLLAAEEFARAARLGIWRGSRR
jgi:penicillin-binding protein 1A